jgi:hypothetical protein
MQPLFDIRHFYDKKIGILGLNNGHHHIGDSIVYSSFPENFYLNFNNKIIDLDNYWIFNNNPYVQRNIQPDIVINIQEEVHSHHQNMIFENIVCRNNFFGRYKLDIHLKKPNLYLHENVQKDEKSICIHLQGKSFNFDLPNEIISYICNKYKDYKIYQIGGKSDREIPGTTDKRGLNIVDTSELIAKSEIFIGINSGMMHLANCYPNVIKKIIIQPNISRELLSIAQIRIPDNTKCYAEGFSWLYLDNDHYNLYNNDIGITKTFLNI